MEKRKKDAGQRMGAEGPQALGDVLSFMRALWAVDHGLRSVSKRMAKRFGVTGPQRLVLRMVGRFPWLSAGDLAKLLHPTSAQLQEEEEAPVLARADEGGATSASSEPAAAVQEAPPAPAEEEPAPPACVPRGKVHFDFDSDYLKPEARETLAQLAECLLSRGGGATITIAGHADERGTEEYNLSLGQRRAEVVRRYLAQLGVPDGGRLSTVSFGEERPAAAGHDEAAWSQNRRAEVE